MSSFFVKAFRYKRSRTGYRSKWYSSKTGRVVSRKKVVRSLNRG